MHYIFLTIFSAVCLPLGQQRVIHNTNVSSTDYWITRKLSDLKCGVNFMRRRQARTINGRNVPPTEYYFLAVFLNYRNLPFCHGSLIHPKFILTAAHCVTGNEVIDNIILGANDFNKPTNYQRVMKYSEIHVHPQFDGHELINDVALVELEGAFIPNEQEKINFVCLPKTVESCNKYDKNTSTLAGWGRFIPGNPYTDADSIIIFDSPKTSDKLLEVRLPIIQNSACQKNYPTEQFSEHYICAGYKRGRKDSCAGDSGGPLLLKLERDGIPDVPTQIAIASWGYACGEPGRPGVYTCVSGFLKWINKIIDTNTAKYKKEQKTPKYLINNRIR